MQPTSTTSSSRGSPTWSWTFQSGTIISVSERTFSCRKRSYGISAGSTAATHAATTA